MTIHRVLTPLCEPVHPAWVNEHTTSISTSGVALQMATGELLMLAPCEVTLDPENYPSLGLSLETCDASALEWVRDGKKYAMTDLPEAASLLPFLVSRVEGTDPLDEGAISEIVLVGQDDSKLLFRHIMPPMTLGIEALHPGQAPNNSFKPSPHQGGA